jgi:hypothetical protein
MKRSKTGASSQRPAPPAAALRGTYAEQYAAGKALRAGACPRNAHSIWKAPAGRPDPVQLVLKA